MDPSAASARLAPYLMVVQRGNEGRYQLLHKLFHGDRVDVVLDRRTGDRRVADEGPAAGADRRTGDRRTPLPDTWVNLGFFVARRRVP